MEDFHQNYFQASKVTLSYGESHCAVSISILLSEVVRISPDFVSLQSLFRSITAASKLYDGGYRNLGWLAGGFNRAEEKDFPAVEGREKLQFATIGGVSYYFLRLLVLLQAVDKG